jgi:hypothetical protein
MKKIANTIKQLSLILGLVIALSYSNSLSAQTDEDYEEDYEEESFFGDGLNGSRFESNLNSDYESARPDYNYKRNQNQSSENAYGNSGATPTYKELDLEVHRESSGNNVRIIGGGGGGGSNGPNNSPNNYVPGIGHTVGTTPPGKGGGPGSYVPDNGGDPDVPIDGGVGILIAAGVGLGLKKKLKRKKTNPE